MIIYALVTRGSVVLVEHSRAQGNFIQISRMLLTKIDTSADARQCYETGDHLFYYTVSNGMIYFCIADKQTLVSKAFAFLDEVRTSFLSSFASRALTADAYTLNDEFERTLSALMDNYNTTKTDKFSKINEQIDATRESMVQNLERILQRGEKIELLVTKTEEIQSNAVNFKQTAVAIRRYYWWRSVKLWIAIGIALVILIWLISSLICGFNYKKCSKSSAPSPPVAPPH